MAAYKDCGLLDPECAARGRCIGHKRLRLTGAKLLNLIKESNEIEGIYGTPEVMQSKVAWDYLTTDQPLELTHGMICKVQKIITLNQSDLRPDQRGYYRDLSRTNVRVGNHIAPAYGQVEYLMNRWLDHYQDMPPWDAHAEFERIHPFVDGNGRTGRMLMWWDELRGDREPTLIEAKDRQLYYAALAAFRGKNS